MFSVRSHFFRALSKAVSLRMNALGSVSRLRGFSERISRPLRLPRGTVIHPLTIGGVPAEWILPGSVYSGTVILYLHGGGWVLGWYQSHRVLSAYIGKASHSRVLAVNYRLAPENPFPGALEDGLTVYRRLFKDGVAPDRIVIAGDSAGGNLTLAMLMALRDAGDPLPAAAVCISPMTDLACTGETFYTNRDALLTSEFAMSMARHYTGDRDPCLPLISPHYGDLTGLPPLLIHAGEDEILLSDARRLADKARKAGVNVTLTVWPNMWHVWHVNTPWLPEAKQAVDAIGGFVRRHAGRSGAGIPEQLRGRETAVCPVEEKKTGMDD